MIKITNLKLAPISDLDDVKQAAAKVLSIPQEAIDQLIISRSAIDARRGRVPTRVCTVLLKTANEAKILKRNRSKDVSFAKESAYALPETARKSTQKPVVVGMGPAGLFTALYLARGGVPSIVLERGGDIDSRAKSVEDYWATGKLDKTSNVQFGEGGAGAFSDGKLTTGTHDGRVLAVLQTLHDFGAPEDIIWSHKPHIGTDILREVVKNIRHELIARGCEIRFNSTACDLMLTDEKLSGIKVSSRDGDYEIATDTAVFAIGHSARDSFEMLHSRGAKMQAKPFAMGVRIEHKQAEINRAQLGDLAEKLPPVDYKLAEHFDNGRSAFTFCVCPGGVVVASASDEGEVVTNGMSYRARDGENINGAVLVGVSPNDYGSEHVLAGVEFQREWERRAFELGGANGNAPAQLVRDFMADRPSQELGDIKPSYKPAVKLCDLRDCLPEFVSETIKLALPKFARKVHGFDADDAVMTGVESRSSSPVRIVRGEDLVSESIKGLYPSGEGAGYAGGIVSAAVDGIKVAEAILTQT